MIKKRIERWRMNIVYHLFAVKYDAQVMFKMKNNYYYRDMYGSLWKLEPTYMEGLPFTISLIERR